MVVSELSHISADTARILFEQVNLDHPGLEPVKAACARGLWERACEELAAYYRRKAFSTGLFREAAPPPPPVTVDGESMLRDVFRMQNVTAVNPRLSDGGLDWSWRGPENDIEWCYYLNRHFFFRDAVHYHKADGDPRYLDFIASSLMHWLGAWPCPDRGVSTPQWRVLEAASRVGTTWPYAFYYLQGHPSFDVASQMRMLLAIIEHGRYVRAYHTRYRNHATLEVGGLLRTTLYWPELVPAEEWRSHAWDRLNFILNRAMYPDGAHKELSSHYHQLVLSQFLSIVETCHRFECAIPGLLQARVSQMMEYLADTMTPSGMGLLNNDGDLEDSRGFLKDQPQVAARPDLHYIVTGGDRGTPPVGTCSRFYPWAGHVLMRDGWLRDAQWLFFDAGPAGVSHHHEDKLHVGVHAGGRDLLVDAGRYTYKPGRMRDYFTSSAAHNVILVGGCGQRRGEKEAQSSCLPRAWLGKHVDFARETHEAGYRGLKGRARHERAVLYLKGRLWIVADTVEHRKRCSIEALWHFHPRCKVVRRGLRVGSIDPGQGNLTIIPLAPTGLKWRPRIVKGRRWFGVQGWWSPTYNELYPAACAVYRAKIDPVATFGWLLVPHGDQPPPLAARVLSSSPHALCIELEWPDGERLHVGMRTAPGRPLVLGNGGEHDCDFVLAKVAGQEIEIVESGCLP